MQRIDDQLIESLRQKGCSGTLDQIEIADGVDTDSLQIEKCEFYGVNKFYGTGKYLKSVFKDSSLFGHNYVCCSAILCSKIGQFTIVKNNSVVKNSATSALKTKQGLVYPVLINNSQIVDDVVLGGTDFNQTKSRGGSIFAFAHIGSGEFVRSTIIGTPPTDRNDNTLVEVGHFGYYGDLTALSLAIKDQSGEFILPDNEKFFDVLGKALAQVYFDTENDSEFSIVRGRSNFGAGTTVSNYDPIKGTKAGAFFLLASCGASVSIPPYLTVLPGSLIASGSVDLTREHNIIKPNSLAIGARERTVIFEGYLDDEQRKIMNDRTEHEMQYLLQSLKLRESIAKFLATAKNEFDAVALKDALMLNQNAAKKLAQKTVPQYFEFLEQSITALGEKTETSPEKASKYNQKLERQKQVMENSQTVLTKANETMEKIEELSNQISNGIFQETETQKYKIVLTKGQQTQLSNSIINIDDL